MLGKLCECCLDGYYKYLAKACGNYMVYNIGAMNNINRKMMQLNNVGYFVLCYDLFTGQYCIHVLVVCADQNSFLSTNVGCFICRFFCSMLWHWTLLLANHFLLIILCGE
jgi:hypothetical protein